MKRWEYMTVHVGRDKAGVEIDSLGAQGWEMVCALDNGHGLQSFYFKRELPPEPAAEPVPTAGYMFPRKNRKEP